MEARLRRYWPIPLRILLGISFLFHGLPKLGAGHAGFVGMLRQLGFPAPDGFSILNITGMTPQGPRFGMPGAELSLLFIAGLLALLIGGPGPLSVDERVRASEREWRSRLPWARRRTA